MKYETLLKLRTVTDAQLSEIALKLYDDVPSTFERALFGTDELPNSSAVLAKVRTATVAELANVALKIASQEFDTFENLLSTPTGTFYEVPNTNQNVFFTNEQLSEIWKQNNISKKIHRIKSVRTYTGLGLKEAKDLVEKYFLGDATSYKVPYTDSKYVLLSDNEVKEIRLLRRDDAIDKIKKITTLTPFEAVDFYESHFKY
jgi:ribosomal protein L7/L12